MRKVIKNKALYEAPVGEAPPPFWIRGLLLLTCTGVSFAHGSNDGQKGMGLIMLILIGTVPTAYALNHAVSAKESQDFIAVSAMAAGTIGHYADAGVTVAGDGREEVTTYVRTRQLAPTTLPGLKQLVTAVGTDMAIYKELRNVPATKTRNFRNDMYLISEALRMMDKAQLPAIAPADAAVLKNYKKHIDKATKFIPTWVKVAVAIALGLGTMIGWKRIVVTVGEKIGKDHLTYAQGAAAELTAMVTIGAADAFGLPVSTTHVLSSGVAGTMAANKTGLQWGTVRNLLMAWVLTLPVSILLSGDALLGVHPDERQLGRLRAARRRANVHRSLRSPLPCGNALLARTDRHGPPGAVSSLFSRGSDRTRKAGRGSGGRLLEPRDRQLGSLPVERARRARGGMSILSARRQPAVALRIRGGRAGGAVLDVPSRRNRVTPGHLHRGTRGGDRSGVSRDRGRG